MTLYRTQTTWTQTTALHTNADTSL
eukprot:COSAG06_NODE_64627_length_259_cov_0.631250_1_plen_24_part_01